MCEGANGKAPGKAGVKPHSGNEALNGCVEEIHLRVRLRMLGTYGEMGKEERDRGRTESRMRSVSSLSHVYTWVIRQSCILLDSGATHDISDAKVITSHGPSPPPFGPTKSLPKAAPREGRQLRTWIGTKPSLANLSKTAFSAVSESPSLLRLTSKIVRIRKGKEPDLVAEGLSLAPRCALAHLDSVRIGGFYWLTYDGS